VDLLWQRAPAAGGHAVLLRYMNFSNDKLRALNFSIEKLTCTTQHLLDPGLIGGLLPHVLGALPDTLLIAVPQLHNHKPSSSTQLIRS
jgi:hypothetical protein